MSEKPTIFERTTQRALATFGIVAAVALLVASCIKKPDNSEIPNASVMAATHDQVQALLTYAIQDMEGKTQEERGVIATETLEKAQKMLDKAQGNK